MWRLSKCGMLCPEKGYDLLIGTVSLYRGGVFRVVNATYGEPVLTPGSEMCGKGSTLRNSPCGGSPPHRKGKAVILFVW